MENQVRIFKTNKGGIKLNYNGYVYEKNREHNNKFYWVCEQRRDNNYKCNVRLITRVNDAQNHEITSKQIKNHNYEPDALREKIQCARNKIKENAVVNPDKKPIHIIAECETKTTPLVLANLPLKINLKQTIYRQRKRMVTITEPTDIHFELKNEYCIPETAQTDQESSVLFI